MDLIKFLPIDIINYMIPFLDLVTGYTIADAMRESGVKFLSISCYSWNKHLIVEKIFSIVKDKVELGVENEKLIIYILQNCTELQSCKIFDILIKNETFIKKIHIPNEYVLSYIFKLIVKYDSTFFLNMLISYIYSNNLFVSYTCEFVYLGKKYWEPLALFLHVICNKNIVKCTKIPMWLAMYHSDKLYHSLVFKKLLLTEQKNYSGYNKSHNYYLTLQYISDINAEYLTTYLPEE